MFRVVKKIHRMAGMLGAIPIFLVAVTGILLNHRSLIGYHTETAIKLQKLIFSMHSGTLAGISIVWITDLSAICMIILSVTGVWMLIMTAVSKRNKRRNKL